MTLFRFHLFVALIFALWAAPTPVWAQRASGAILIRDAEIETTLKNWAEPVIRAAGLEPENVRIILVQSPDLNAFVAGGPNIFIYTGLLDKSENAGEVVGVIAHELGHIAGGHLVRAQDQMENASYEVMIGTILGLGAALVGGTSDAALAVTSGAMTLAQRNYLSFSRTQEASADQAAVRFMRTAQINPSGLVSFMEKLSGQELLPLSQQNEYVRTHPISRDRVDYLESALGGSDLRNKPFQADWADQHARMKAKLSGFITPEQVVWIYPDQKQTIPAQYARAIAAYRQNRVDEALVRVENLIKQEPKNGYFQELKGQMLFDFGRVALSVAAYERAVALQPDQPLIKLAYAQALIESPGANAVQLNRAISVLEQARLSETRNPRLFRQLGTAYGHLGRDGEAQAMLAEEAFLQGRYTESSRFIDGAFKQLPPDSRLRRALADLQTQIEAAKKKKKDE